MTGNHSRPRFFAFVGTLLVFLLVNLICALPLFCFEKSYERERERALLTFRNISLVSIRHLLSNTRSRLLPLISKGIRYLFSARQRRNLWVARFISLWKGISPLNDFIVLHSFSSPFLELPLLKYSLQFLQNEFFFGYFLPKYLVSMMLYFANENIQIL